MQLPRDAILLRIFFGEEDRANRLPLHEAIVLKAREMHLAGATVLHVPDIIGSSRVHEGQKTRNDRVYLHQLRHIMEEYREMLIHMADVVTSSYNRPEPTWDLAFSPA